MDGVIKDAVYLFSTDTQLTLEAAVRTVLERLTPDKREDLYANGYQSGRVWCSKALHEGGRAEPGVAGICAELMQRPEIARVARLRSEIAPNPRGR